MLHPCYLNFLESPGGVSRMSKLVRFPQVTFFVNDVSHPGKSRTARGCATIHRRNGHQSPAGIPWGNAALRRSNADSLPLLLLAAVFQSSVGTPSEISSRLSLNKAQTRACACFMMFLRIHFACRCSSQMTPNLWEEKVGLLSISLEIIFQKH